MLTDLRHAIRGAQRSPASSLVIVVCLALGLAVTTTMFGIANALIFRPLPYPDPDRLVIVRERLADAPEGMRGSLAVGNFVDYRAEARSFAGFGAYQGRAYNVSTERGAEYVEGAAVSPSLFGVLGVRPILGRGFLPEEEGPGRERVVILGHDVWERLFEGDRGVIGRRALVNGEPYTVVGVMPPRFGFPQTDHLWTPLTIDPARAGRSDHAATGVARLRDGATLATARAELDVVARRLAAQYPKTNASWRVTAVGMRDDMMGTMRVVVAIFQTATLLVLLVACANVANVVIARAAGRERELAMRAALGAGRWRLAALVLLESTVLAVVAGAIAVLLATWAVKGFVAAIPVERPYWLEFGFDGRVFAYALGAAIAAGAIAGLPAALRASRHSLQIAAGGDARTAGGSRAQTRLRGALVVAQLALSLVLVVGASLLGKSIVGVQRVDPGFAPAGLMTMRVELVGASYGTGAGRTDAVTRTVERLAGLPGVSAAAAVAQLPMRGGNITQIDADGVVLPLDDRRREVTWNAVTPGYFRAMRIPVLAGRDFGIAETRDTTICLVSSAMARSLWGDRSALGSRIHLGPRGAGKWVTVVGIVGDVRQWGLNEPPSAEFYLPYGAEPPQQATFVARGGSDAGALVATLAPAMRTVMRATAPGIAAVDVTPMTMVIRDAHWQPKVFTVLFVAFGVAALVLAAAGVYGVTAYAVSQRTREIGVRVALGAPGTVVVALIARRGLRLAVAGTVAGLLLALGASQALRGILVGVSPSDPLVFASAALLLGTVAVAANVLPARRAARVDPATVLRAD